MMWYVKLFGFQPCLIFGIVPLVATRFIPNATVAAAIGAISTLAWVSGACYLLLWFVSIVWAFPIKHRIRKLNRDYSPDHTLFRISQKQYILQEGAKKRCAFLCFFCQNVLYFPHRRSTVWISFGKQSARSAMTLSRIPASPSCVRSLFSYWAWSSSASCRSSPARPPSRATNSISPLRRSSSPSSRSCCMSSSPSSSSVRLASRRQASSPPSPRSPSPSPSP